MQSKKISSNSFSIQIEANENSKIDKNFSKKKILKQRSLQPTLLQKSSLSPPILDFLNGSNNSLINLSNKNCQNTLTLRVHSAEIPQNIDYNITNQKESINFIKKQNLIKN